MVMSRAAKSNHTPSIREVLSSSGRVVSHRVYEFPSLSFRERFGFGTSQTSASTQPTSGPLRVTIRLPDPASIAAPPRRLSTRYSRSYTDDISAATVAESRVGGRRVRFELPPPLNGSATNLSNGSAVKQVAGVDSWLRSRTGYPTVETLSSSSSSLGGFSGIGTIQHQQHSSTPSSGPHTTSSRVHDTGRYRRGTLPPTPNDSPTEHTVVAVTKPGVIALLEAARDGDEKMLGDCLKIGEPGALTEEDVNAVDSGGRTAVSYIASHGSLPMLETILQVPGVDVNKPDNEGNTPLHFAAQAGYADNVNFILTHCSGVKVDARNDLGFTPLMKAALQGRSRCAKLLIFAGASPILKDTGKGLRAEEWARYCGRYVCAEMIMKISRHRLLDRTSSHGRWGSEPELGVVPSKIQPNTQAQSQGFKTKLKQAFRTKSNSSLTPDKSRYSSLVTQLTSAALCASTPVLPTRGTCSQAVRSIIRPLAVPKLHVTLVGKNAVESTSSTMPENREVSPKSTGTGSRQIYLKKKK